MKRVIILNFLLLIVLLSVVNCSNEKNDNSNVKNESVTTIDGSFLANKNFVYKNITNTTKVNLVYKSTKGNGLDLSNIYTDSTLKKTYVQLSESQKGFLIAPFLPKDYGAKYAKENMCAWFVSKQNKIGEVQPIILLVVAKNDYESLTLMLLDKNHKPVSEFSLDEENDNDKIGYPHKTKSYSFFNKNEIESYRISENTDSTKKQMTIDSNVFKSVINKNGTISTKQIGKTRFTKLFK